MSVQRSHVYMEHAKMKRWAIPVLVMQAGQAKTVVEVSYISIAFFIK